MRATAAVEAPKESGPALEVVLEFTSLDDYRRMGDHIAAVRGRLGLPAWSTPAEVIAAALREQAEPSGRH